MSFRTLLLAATATVFSVIGDVKVSITYHHQTSTTYNPTTGQTSRVESTEAVDVVLAEFERRDIDGERIMPTDRRVLIEAAELASAPALNDRLTISGETWEVMHIRGDPIVAHYDLHLRRP